MRNRLETIRVKIKNRPDITFPDLDLMFIVDGSPVTQLMAANDGEYWIITLFANTYGAVEIRDINGGMVPFSVLGENVAP